MTVTPQPGSAPPEGDARAEVVSQYWNASTWAACHPDAQLPRKAVVPLEVPGAMTTYGMALLWLEEVAKGWDVPVTEDEAGNQKAVKRFGGLCFAATVKPADYSAAVRLDADRAAYLEALA